MVTEPLREGVAKMIVLNVLERGHAEGRLPGLKERVVHVGSKINELSHQFSKFCAGVPCGSRNVANGVLWGVGRRVQNNAFAAALA